MFVCKILILKLSIQSSRIWELNHTRAVAFQRFSGRGRSKERERVTRIQHFTRRYICIYIYFIKCPRCDVSDSRSDGNAWRNRCAESPIDSCDPLIRTAIKKWRWEHFSLRWSECPSRVRVFSRLDERLRSLRDYVHTTRGDPSRGRRSIQSLRDVPVSLSRTEETCRRVKAEERE